MSTIKTTMAVPMMERTIRRSSTVSEDELIGPSILSRERLEMAEEDVGVFISIRQDRNLIYPGIPWLNTLF
jgi:hypothetical protein